MSLQVTSSQTNSLGVSNFLQLQHEIVMLFALDIDTAKSSRRILCRGIEIHQAKGTSVAIAPDQARSRDDGVRVRVGQPWKLGIPAGIPTSFRDGIASKIFSP